MIPKKSKPTISEELKVLCALTNQHVHHCTLCHQLWFAETRDCKIALKEPMFELICGNCCDNYVNELHNGDKIRRGFEYAIAYVAL